jgi:hypothetical protein
MWNIKVLVHTILFTIIILYKSCLLYGAIDLLLTKIWEYYSTLMLLLLYFCAYISFEEDLAFYFNKLEFLLLKDNLC